MNTWLCELGPTLSQGSVCSQSPRYHRVKEEEVVVCTAGAWGLFRSLWSEGVSISSDPSQGQRQSVRGNRMLVPRRAVPKAKATGSALLLPLLLRLLLWPLAGGRNGSLGFLRHLCTSGLRLLCLRLMGLRNGYDDGQDTDELEDSSQEEPIPQQVLQEGGLRYLRR